MQAIKSSLSKSNLSLKDKFRIIYSSQEHLTKHTNLINKAYDKEDSWTDRKLIIKIDARISAEELSFHLNQEKNKFFILQEKETNNFLGCVKIEYAVNHPEFTQFADIPFFTIELFCTDPDYQSQGLGKYMFLFAEKIIKLASVFHAKNTKDQEAQELESLKDQLTENYDIPQDLFDSVQKYSENIFSSEIGKKEIENIYIKVILAKTGLYNFYTKYGYANTDVKISLHKYLRAEQVLVDSHFGILNKKISDIKV